MKKLSLAVITAVAFSLLPARAQMGGPGMGGSPLSGSMTKLFGNNTAFSGMLEMNMNMGGQAISIPGKISFDHGKARFEMNMTDMKGLPPQALDQMKAMGMDKMVTISNPDKKVSYMLYPGSKSYLEMPLPNADAAKSDSDTKIETTELGKETVDGHATVKKKAVITDEKGAKHEATIWSATDLKEFPIKIETSQGGNTMTMVFKDVKLSAPEASQFELPADYKKMSGMMGMPPGHPGQP